MSKQINVLKSTGELELLDYDKINKVLSFACEGLDNVSPSLIAMQMNVKFFNKITTTEIHDAAIRTAADLISEDYPNYQFVAARLLNYKIRKMVWGGHQAPRFYDHIVKVTEMGFYDTIILEKFTESEINQLEKHIKHSNDELFSYAGMKQFESKYLVRNRSTRKLLETPQFAYMLVSTVLHADYPIENRMKHIVSFYNLTSNGPKSLISLPTPIIAGVRTPTRQFSSCVVLKQDDSLESINAVNSAIVSYASKRAGIGVDVGRLRPVGAPIRGGEVVHTGMIPFIKVTEAATKSSSQGAIRAGSSTCYYPIMHYEIEDLLVLKNNKGSDDTRARNMDYGVQINGHFYRKAMKKEEYCLFNFDEVPDLYEAFFNNQELYEELYDKYSRSRKKMIKRVNAYDLLTSLISERISTGRIYIANVDNMNNQSSLKSTIYSSNLCLEVYLSTSGLTKLSNLKTEDVRGFGFDLDNMKREDFVDEFGEIALCTLAAINWGNIKTPSDFEEPCRHIVIALDNLLSFQDYPMVAAEIPAKARRTLGVGIINFAHFLAQRKLKYGEGLEVVDEYMEAMYYYLVKASVELAKVKGPCEWLDDTIYGDGVFVHERRTPFIDTIVPHNPKMDWESLREEMKTYGIRNSTLIALMPAESSAIISNSTNGIEPPRSMVTTKGSKESIMKQIVPNPRLKYDYVWEQLGNDGYIKTMGVLQKYIDQGISNNLNYNPDSFSNSQIPMSQMIKDVLLSYKLGHKGLYYANTRTSVSVDETGEGCESCKI
jgi:ribonucleoside-diphosphate reductase alpha chain